MELRCNVKVLARRFAEGRPDKCRNASVSVVQCADHAEISYRLHNTTILRGKKYPGDSNTRLHLLTWGAWLTRTTQAHINRVLRALSLPTISRTNWANCPRTISTTESDYVVHYAEYIRGAHHVTGLILHMDRAAEQPLIGLLHWLHHGCALAVQRMSEYDFSQGMDGQLPAVVKALLGAKRRKVCYIGPILRGYEMTLIERLMPRIESVYEELRTGQGLRGLCKVCYAAQKSGSITAEEYERLQYAIDTYTMRHGSVGWVVLDLDPEYGHMMFDRDGTYAYPNEVSERAATLWKEWAVNLVTQVQDASDGAR